MSNYVGGDGNALIDTELYQLLVTGNVIGFNRVVSSSQVDVLEVRCARDNNTVLHIACSSGKVELVNDILIQWPELMVQGNSQGDLPIHTAVQTGRMNVAVVDALASWLQQQQALGINVVVHQVLEWSNVEGNTALHTALEVYGNEEVKQARELVDLYPPAAYAMNIEGICPLYLAILKELADLVQHMLQKLQPFKEDALNCLTNGQSVLHAVVSAQKTEMLEHLLLYGDGKLINLVNEEGLTALSYATFKGYLEKVQIFVTKVSNSALICNKDKSFPIHQAVRGGHISIIGLLSGSRFLLNGRGQSILHLAILIGDSKLVSYVLSLSDVDPLLNQNDDDGNTPLHLATLSKHVEVVELLIQNEGVNVGLLNKEGLMAHDLAKELTFVDDTSKRVVMRLNLMLEKATNDIKLFPIDGNLYLHLFKGEINRVSESIRRLQLKDLLTLDEGENVLHIAACRDSTPLILDLLHRHGCTTLMYQANKKGDLPIHSAVKLGHFWSLIGFFLWLPSIPSDRICMRPNIDGNTALHVAVLYNHRKLAKYLYEKCPKAAYCLNKDNICPLFLAIKYWSTSENELINNMIQGLEEDRQLQDHLKGAESIVHIAILARSKVILKSIINKAPGLLDSLDNDGRSPLSYAAFIGHVKAVKLLLKKYPDLEFKRDKDKNGSFPIHHAAEGGFVSVIKLFHHMHLLNSKDQNVLHVAAKNDDSNYIIAYYKRNLKELINTADDNGNTPLHLAVKGFHLCAVYRLLKYQDIKGNLKNKELQTPLDIFIMHMKCADEKGLSSLQIHLMEVMLNIVNGRTFFSTFTRRDDLEVKEKFKEVEATKIYERKNRGSNGSTSKERANAFLVVATLIITVTFASALSPPGGYNEQTGLPNLVSHESFQFFVSRNSVAFIYGILTAILLILGMYIEGFTEISLYYGGWYIFLGLSYMACSFRKTLTLYTAKKDSQTTRVKNDIFTEYILPADVSFWIAFPFILWAFSKVKVTIHWYLRFLLPFATYGRYNPCTRCKVLL